MNYSRAPIALSRATALRRRSAIATWSGPAFRTRAVWGDTVNIASRMESNGVGGQIQVTEAVMRALMGHIHSMGRS